MKRVGLYIVFLLLLNLRLSGQDYKEYSFTHHGASGGLSSNEATQIVQDSKGFIWLGSTNGLQRFDGIRYRTFRAGKDVPGTIPSNYVVQLMVDKKGNLWMLTGDGKVGIFDTEWFIYREIKVKPKDETGLLNERILMEDEDGNILLLLRNIELLTFSPKKKEFSAAYNFIPVPKGWKFWDFKQQPGTKKYWFGRSDGLAIYNRETGHFSYSEKNTDKEPIIDQMGTITTPTNFLFDQKGRVWFTHWGNGIPLAYCFNLKTKQVVLNEYSVYSLLRTYHEMRGFVEQKDGSVWIYGLKIFGKYLENENRFQMVQNGYQGEQSINYDRINFLYEDREQNLWVATFNNGIYRFNPADQFFTNFRQKNPNTGLPGDGSVMSFMLTKRNTILSGAWGDGIFEMDQKELKLARTTIKGVIAKYIIFAWSMYASGDSNTIWIGGQPGILKVDQKTWTSTYHNPPIMKERTVRQVVEDKYGNLWMGTQGAGLYKWTASKPQKKFEDAVTPIPDVPPAVLMMKLMIDKDGLLWVCTHSRGIYVIDPATDKVVMHFGTQEPEERKLLVDAANSILQYDDTTIVFGVQGLQIYNTKKKRITRTITLPESVAATIASMEKDRDGYVWVSMTNGIYRVNLRNEIFIHFDRLDGIANDHFIHAASYVLPDGKMLFGADNQFILFDPSKVQINEPAPRITITDFALKNRALLVDSLLLKDKVELAPEDNSIIIGFSGLRYNGAYIIRYKLDKLDKDWVRADKTNQAVYSYLPPGTYTFQVRSEDAEGNPSEITTLIIKVRPPFWKTWWFLGLVIFAATAVLFWLDKLRMQRLRATESIRTRIATSLTEDMSNSLSSINISSELAKTKIDTNTQRTKEYIAQISETSNRMVQAMYDMVWSIDPKNDTMANTIERMKIFSGEAENNSPVNIDFDIDKQVENLRLDMEHRYELLSIYKEAVMNAAKHAHGRYIKISIRYSNSKLILMVIDDGRGFIMDDASMLGRGISDMRRRAAAINATLYIESEINTGTIVKLEMPVTR